MNKTASSFFLSIAFLSIAFLASTKGFTMKVPIKKWVLTTYELLPGKVFLLENPWPDTITVLCHMNVVSSQEHSILVKVLNGEGQVNGTVVIKGQMLIQTVQNQQVIPVIANPEAKAELTNLGPDTITAACD